MSSEATSLIRGSVSAAPDPEADLVARAVGGEAEAFGALYERHVDSIYRYALARVGNVHEAEDLTELVFLKTWEALGRYHAGVRFRALLFRIAHNLIVDHYRTRKWEVNFAEASPDDCPDLREPEPGMIAGERLARLATALAQLDPAQQQIVTLRFIAGMSHAETAQVVGKSDGAVRVLQHRALAALRAVLQKGAPDEW